MIFIYRLRLSFGQLDDDGDGKQGPSFLIVYFCFSLTEMTSDVPSLGPSIASGNPGPGIQGGGTINVQRPIKRRPG